MGRSSRLIPLLVACGVTFAGAAFLLTAPPPGVSREALKGCTELPTRDCLLDIGAARLHASKTLPDSLTWIPPFAESGRLDEAEAILDQAALRGAVPDKMLSVDRRIITEFRIRDALRAGKPLDQVLRESLQSRPFRLGGIGRSIRARNSYLGLGPYRPAVLSTGDLGAIRAIAEQIVIRAESEPTRWALEELDDAADLFATLGDRDRVLHVVALMKQNGVDPRGLREPIFRMIGSAPILELVGESDSSYWHMLRRAGTTEPDDAKAANYLRRSFEVAETGQIWPNSGQMLRVIKDARARGFETLAEALSDRLLQSATDTLDQPFGVFRLLDAAKGRAAVGAEAMEVANILARAEANFPKSPSTVVAIGLNAGPMAWGPFGLADEAYGIIAAVSAEIGDVETAIRALELGSDKIQLWLGLAPHDIAPADLDRLLSEARRSLSSEDASYVTGQLLRRFVDFDDGSSRGDWALKIARTLYHDPKAMRAHKGAVANAVAAVGCKQSDAVLCRAAIKAIGQIALDSADVRLIMRAALITPPPGHL